METELKGEGTQSTGWDGRGEEEFTLRTGTGRGPGGARQQGEVIIPTSTMRDPGQTRRQ